VGKQEVGAATVGFVVSALIVIFALVVGNGAPRDDNGVPEWLTGDEGTASEQEPELPDWLTDYNLHVPLIGYIYSPADRHARRVRRAESDALMDSLSPGVRASLEGAGLAQAAASEGEHEREEAEYRAFIEERMRRLGEGRSLAD
jgi:hypothetical protein